MQVALNKTYMELQAERSTLEAKAPLRGAPLKESDAYRKKIAALNAKIDHYEEQHAEYKEKENAFKAQLNK